MTGVTHLMISLLDLNCLHKAFASCVPQDEGSFVHRSFLPISCNLETGMQGDMSSGRTDRKRGGGKDNTDNQSNVPVQWLNLHLKKELLLSI